jgi:hypothetical protein
VLGWKDKNKCTLEALSLVKEQWQEEDQHVKEDAITKWDRGNVLNNQNPHVKD